MRKYKTTIAHTTDDLYIVAPAIGLLVMANKGENYVGYLTAEQKAYVDAYDTANPLLGITVTVDSADFTGNDEVGLVAVPSTATSPGNVGDMAFASGFIYICHAANTWKRVAVVTW